MKLLFTSVLVFGLCSATATVLAAQDKAFYLASCKEQLRPQFGSQADIKLVSLRRARDGMRVKVAVRLERGGDGVQKVQFTTCLVSPETGGGGIGGEGLPPPADSNGGGSGQGR